MGIFDWVEFEGGRGRFCGTAGDRDDDRHPPVFAIAIGNGHTYFGIFDLDYTNGNPPYDVAITAFGFRHETHVLRTEPGFRTMFVGRDIPLIQQAIRALFLSDADKPFPISDFREGFSRKIVFRDGWIWQAK